MLSKIRLAVIAMMSAFLVCGCTSRLPVSIWESEAMWYEPANERDPENVDVLYLLSTEVLSARDENGDVSWRSQLAAEDKDAMRNELAWVETNIFSDGFNLAAPYYHQFTFDAISKLKGGEFSEVYSSVAKEVCDAFDYYMKNVNNGRRFILAGFSQGAMLCLDLLRHMSDEEYSSMVACYTIGYRLSESDLQHPHIKAAEGASDTGGVISFNSSLTREAIWPLVSEGAVTCINPVNWRTDSTPAEFHFDGTTNIVSVDPATHVLLVQTDKPEYFHDFYELAPFFLDAGVSRDNLHHWDLLFYSSQIHDNALVRADAFEE